MKKVIKLTESQLIQYIQKTVDKVMNESDDASSVDNDLYQFIVNTVNKFKVGDVSDEARVKEVLLYWAEYVKYEKKYYDVLSKRKLLIGDYIKKVLNDPKYTKHIFYIYNAITKKMDMNFYVKTIKELQKQENS